MRSIVILRPAEDATLAQFNALLVEEEKVLWSYMTDGKVRNISYADQAPATVVLEFETTDISEVHALTQAFPLVKAGLLVPEVLGLSHYQGLAALFDTGHGIAPQLPASWRQAA